MINQPGALRVSEKPDGDSPEAGDSPRTKSVKNSFIPKQAMINTSCVQFSETRNAPNQPAPDIDFLVSSPQGDLPPDENRWHLPLEGDQNTISYREYFYAIRDFILHDSSTPLVQAASHMLDAEIGPHDLKKAVIRSEKHGVHYHPASVEAFYHQGRIKCCLNLAVHERGKKQLEHEAGVLRLLDHKFGLPYLPRPYFQGRFNSMFFLVAEWFEGCHEFHLSLDHAGRQRLKLWDYDDGPRFLPPEQCFEIYRRIAFILTSYYDPESTAQIYPWHHAAGDFVAGIREQEGLPAQVRVRLTTARGYTSLVDMTAGNLSGSIIGLFHFFLNLTIRMRLDRLDGVGETVWADDLCLEASVQGFFDALKNRPVSGSHLPSADVFLEVLKSFSPGELRRACPPILETCQEIEDLPIILPHLDEHIDKLHTLIQSYDL